MARVSTKANKNIYQRIREALHLTRESASDLLESLPPERIEKIENERSLPHPDEVLVMAEKYKQQASATITAPISAQLGSSTSQRSKSRISLRLSWKCWHPSTP